MAKRSFYRTANAVLGQIGGRAPEDVILELICSKCLPALLYGLEACPLRKSDISSLDFVVNRFFMKLFQTNNIDKITAVHSLNLIYLALLLRNVVRSLLQNIDHVKMLYVNLRNLFHCCFFCVC